MSKPVISARDLAVRYLISNPFLGEKVFLNAIDGVSIDIERGNFFGLVGESGSGKTTLGRAILKAAPISAGHVTTPMTRFLRSG